MWMCKVHTGKHRGTGPSALTLAIHAAETGKEILGIDSRLLRLVELVGKDVDHQLAVAVRVDVPMRLLVKEALELLRVDEVPVVRKANAVGTIDIEGLSLGIGAASSSRISQMTQAHESGQIADACAIVEDSGGHAIAFALVDSPAG